MKKYLPTTIHERRERLLASLRFTLSFMIKCKPELRQYLYIYLGYRLLHLENEKDASTAFRALLSKTVGDNSYKPFPCRQCKSQRVPKFICKSCSDPVLCSECIKGYQNEEIPWCHDHQFLEVPGEGSKNSPETGVFGNYETEEEWLNFLQDRYGEIDVEELGLSGVGQERNRVAS